MGIASWSVIEHPPQSKEELDAAFESASKARFDVPPIEGMNEEIDRAFFRAAFYSEAEIVGEQPYMMLRILAVHPEHQRRGVGKLLLQQGLDRADRLGLPVYLDAGESGKPVYERYGFEVKKVMPLDCTEYGGRSDGRHWCMLRPPKA